MIRHLNVFLLTLQEDVMQLCVVNGVLFSGDYGGMVKKWDVSNEGKN